MAGKFTLGKKEKLKSRKLIGQLFSEGKNFPFAGFRVYYLFSPLTRQQQDKMPPVLFGIGVSSKNFKKAVDRNRVKRLVRESYRLQKTELQKKLREKKLSLNLFFIYTSRDIPGFITVKENLKLILDRMINIADENISSNS